MAEAISTVFRGIAGNEIKRVHNITFADNSATCEVQTGCKRVTYAEFQPAKGCAQGTVQKNVLVANTAALGYVTIHSATSAQSGILITHGI